MVAGHHQHIRLEGQQFRHAVVEVGDGLLLAREVAVLAGGVGRLVVDEEEVVVVPVLAHGGDLRRERVPCVEHVHANEAREPAIHRVGRDGGGAQLPELRELRQLR